VDYTNAPDVFSILLTLMQEVDYFCSEITIISCDGDGDGSGDNSVNTG
jgi:hypothetical protein